MNRLGHRSGAVAGALAVASATGMRPASAAVLVGAAYVTSTLPDIDQTKPWRMLDKVVPDEWFGGPLAHRGLTHWWGIPAVAYATTLSLTGYALDAAHGLILGYAAHIALDAVWGRPGVPVGPWWWHAGVGLRNDGAAAVVATAGFLVAALWLAACLLLDLPADPRWLTN